MKRRWGMGKRCLQSRLGLGLTILLCLLWGFAPAQSQRLTPPTELLAGQISVNATPALEVSELEASELEASELGPHHEVTEDPNSSPRVEPPVATPEIGWEFSGQRNLNAVTIAEQEYYGDCPGRQRHSVRARFFSSELPPADRRRVVVRNVTRGVDDDPFPYTDREYDEGRSSEATKMRFGTKHSGRYFHVLPGVNEFEYEIKARRRGPVLQTGTFTAEITRDLQRIQRDATYGEDEVCANSRVNLNVCADVRDRHKWSCPNGSIIRSELFPDDPRVITEIHNHTEHTIEVSINGRMRRIFPGSYYDFDRRHPSIRYESNGERRSRSLTSGTRYRFYERDGQVRIEEYRRHSRW